MCVIMAALLIVLMFMNHRRNQERADELRRKTEERKVLETQKMEKAAELYDQYLDQLSGTSVVCWGDAVMAGKGDASLASALEAVISENLYQPFTESYSKVVDTEEMTQPGASVTNSYTFRAGSASNSTSVIPASMTQTVKNNGGSTVSSVTYNYTYDVLGNIETISEGSTLKVKYYYDRITYNINFDGNGAGHIIFIN